MLDNVSAKYRDQIKVCSRIGDEEIRNARLETTTKDREKYWRCWKNFARIVGVDPFSSSQSKSDGTPKHGHLSASEGASDEAFVDEVNRSLATQLHQRSPQLERQLPWCARAKTC